MHLFALLRWLLGTTTVDASLHSRFLDTGTDLQQSRLPAGGDSHRTVRKDLLRIVLRTTLERNGIPPAWIGADALTATSGNRIAGLHIRFVVRHWDARIALHAPAFQDDFARRLLAFDPLAVQWLRGYSWRYDLPAGSAYPPLPHPGSWTAQTVASLREWMQRPSQALPATSPIISGPVIIEAPRPPTSSSGPPGHRRGSPAPDSTQAVPPSRLPAQDYVTTEPTALL